MTPGGWRNTGNQILGAPNAEQKAEAMARAKAERLKRAEVAKAYKAVPRKFRELSVADRVEVMKRRKREEEHDCCKDA